MCKHLNDGKCLVAYSIALADCPVTQQQCDYCTNKAEPPQDINVVTVSIATKYTKDQSNIKPEHIAFVLEREPTHKEFVGTELKKLISWFPIPKAKECKACHDLERKMNRWGRAKCIEKKNYIIKKLKIAARRRNLPFSEHLVTILIDKAIRNSR